MYYGDKEDSKVVIMKALQLRGWLIYGYKPDRSDSMTDYFDPARWDGIAMKNGYILVLDGYKNGKIGGATVHQSYDMKLQKKLQKLYALRDNHAASEGEKANAQSIIDSISQKVVTEIMFETGLPEVSYQKNPGNAKWHIERDGRIIDKGNGIFSFSSMQYRLDSESYTYKTLDDNEARVIDWYNYNHSDWEKHFEFVLEKRKEQEKLLDKLDALLERWENAVRIKIGDGDEDILVQTTVQKKSFYYVPIQSDIPTEYVALGKKWQRYRGLESGKVYKIKDQRYCKLTPQWLTLQSGESLKAFKPEPNKSTKPTFSAICENDFAQGHVYYVALEKREEVSEEVVWIRQSKLKNQEPKEKEKEQKPSQREELISLTAASLATVALYSQEMLQVFAEGRLF